MKAAEIDQLAAVKASLELMVSDNNGIHEYFRDLLEKVSELDEMDEGLRRQRFKDLVRMGAFRFNGVDIRHFTQSQINKPLSPPIFLNRTRRRLQNTIRLVAEFEKRRAFPEATRLREEIEALASHIVNENDTDAVKNFKKEVETLRDSSLFRHYLETKKAFIQQDADFKTDAEMLAARESVEESEEIFRQRADDLSELSAQLEKGGVSLDEIQAKLDELTIEKTG
jgi:hypothetical protein